MDGDGVQAFTFTSSGLLSGPPLWRASAFWVLGCGGSMVRIGRQRRDRRHARCDKVSASAKP
jgi:hypothetical protein